MFKSEYLLSLLSIEQGRWMSCLIVGQMGKLILQKKIEIKYDEKINIKRRLLRANVKDAT